MDGIKDEGEDGSNSSPRRPPGAAADVTRSASDEYGIMARPAPSAPAVAVACAVAGAGAGAGAGAENRTDDDGNATTTIAEALQMVETLTGLFGFDFDVAHDAVNAVGAKDVTLCCDYILNNGLGRDVGGAVAPIDDCPHLLSLGLSASASAATDNLPPDVMSRPCCYYLREGAGKGRQRRSGRGGMGVMMGRPKDDVDPTTGICPMGENWMCLTCGDVYCSRYVNGHGVQHWQDSCIIKGGGEEKECQHDDDDDGDDRGSYCSSRGGGGGCGNNNNNNNNNEHEHCVMVSLADLSVWCHRCAAYLRHESLKPILRRLEEIKFKDDNDDGGIYDDEQLRAQKKGKADHSSHNKIGPVSSPTTVPPNMAGGGTMLEYPFGNQIPSSLAEVAAFMRSDRCRTILILAGAGMSVASGIPDFRSPNSGIYAQIRADPSVLTADQVQLDLIKEDPTNVFLLSLFLQNPLPCLEAMREMIVGTKNRRWKATLAHHFVRLLQQKLTHKLKRIYTQNIDGLEDQLLPELPSDKVVAVHGSMDGAECARCHTVMDYGRFADNVERHIKDIHNGRGTRVKRRETTTKHCPHSSHGVECAVCGYYAVKPSVTLFGEALPSRYFEMMPNDVQDVDLLLIFGTSLVVAPANRIVQNIPATALRVVLDRHQVGKKVGMQYGAENKRDCFIRGNLEGSILDLWTELGWAEELRDLMCRLDSGRQMLPDASAAMLRKKIMELDLATRSTTNDDHSTKP